MPESQWPAAFPTQQAIAALPEEALEIGTKIAKNDNATAIATNFSRKDAKMQREAGVLLGVFASLRRKIFIDLIRLRRLFFDNRFSNQFHFALAANAA